MTSSRSLLLLVALLGAGAALTQAQATPLDAEACAKLMVEHGALENTGAEQTLLKGPEWAKANLTPDKINQIKRFIELEELIQFRCRSKSRVVLPPDPEEKEKEKAQDKDKAEAKDEHGKDTPGKDAAAPSKAKIKAKANGDAKAQPKAAAEPKAKSAAQQPPGSGVTTVPKSAPKGNAKAKLKADGAPKTKDDNPFGSAFEDSAK